MQCTSCHADLGETTPLFCPQCGAKIAPDAPSVEETPAPRRARFPWLTLVIGSIAVFAALQGLAWAVRQEPPRRQIVLPDEPEQMQAPVPTVAPEPKAEAKPIPPQVGTITFIEDEKEEEEEVAAEEAIPTQQPASPLHSAVTAEWLSRMREELTQCNNGFFCLERVRWKYCNNRWNSVPECAIGANQD
ncbi:MAG: hypothetical protein LBO00_05720 [Zoogloeaceae bacterium]|jgi:hypothetical protein|nr:hypothetical protein [Zoogloeaceae bacterium]